jgi:hypothetical protein
MAEKEKKEQELLFEGGPTLEEVEQWKSEHGDIYMSDIEETTYVWRPVYRKEYKDLLKNKEADAFYREERLCEKCVLWPKDYNFMAMSRDRAGVPSCLSEQIMEKSGFVPTSDAKKL